MYKTWTFQAASANELARAIEVHLNEFARDIISVSYAVTDQHHALIVYRSIDMQDEAALEVVVAEAVQIIDEAKS